MHFLISLLQKDMHFLGIFSKSMHFLLPYGKKICISCHHFFKRYALFDTTFYLFHLFSIRFKIKFKIAMKAHLIDCLGSSYDSFFPVLSNTPFFFLVTIHYNLCIGLVAVCLLLYIQVLCIFASIFR